ncbi:MAG TPA: polysaccharide deacetylase family protein [Magnetospirillum sp.]|nr:polysaccharide deacetylase family protein [Magnetospirillum sp.]
MISAPILAVIETHFIGDYSTAPVRLPALTVRQFETALDRLLAEYEPVTAARLRDWFAGEADLPSKGVYLSFDDGIRDHVTNVLPVLQRRGLEGSFFVPGSILAEDGRLPPLERQRFLQYAFGDYPTFLAAFVATVQERFGIAGLGMTEENLGRMGDYLADYAFYTDEERYYRWLRDTVLTPEQFLAVVDQLFAARFPDERALFATYYLSANELAELKAAGMVVGAHGYVHEHLPRLADPRADMERGMAAIEGVIGERPWIASYPYGSYDQGTVALMRDLRMAFAFTTQNQIATLDRGNPYEIRRLDIAELSR